MVRAAYLEMIKGQETAFLYQNRLISENQFNELLGSAGSGLDSIYRIHFKQPVKGEAKINVAEFVPMGSSMETILAHYKMGGVWGTATPDNNPEKIQRLEERLKNGDVWDIKIYELPELVVKTIGELISKYQPSEQE